MLATAEDITALRKATLKILFYALRKRGLLDTYDTLIRLSGSYLDAATKDTYHPRIPEIFEKQKSDPKVREYILDTLVAPPVILAPHIPLLPPGMFSFHVSDIITADILSRILALYHYNKDIPYAAATAFDFRYTLRVLENQYGPPRNYKKLLPHLYVKDTPLEHLIKAKLPVSLKNEKATNHFFIGAPGHGKTSQIMASVLEHLQEPDPPAMLIIDPHNQMADELESLALWKNHPGKLVHIDPRDRPAMNILDLPNMDDVAASFVAEMYDDLFQSDDTGMTGLQAGAFTPLMMLLIEKRKAEGATIADAFDFLDAASQKGGLSPYWQKYLDKLPQRRARTLTSIPLQTINSIRARLSMIDRHPTFMDMLCANENKIDLYDMLHTKKQTVLVTTRGITDPSMYLRYIMLSAVQTAFRRESVPEPKRHPILIFVDEAGEVFRQTDLAEKVIRQCRKYGLWLRTYAQDLDGLNDSSFVKLLLGFSGVKIVAGALKSDARELAEVMNCDPSELSFELPRNATHFKFIVRITGMEKPFTLTLPKGPLNGELKLKGDELKEHRAAVRHMLQGTTPSPAVHTPDELDPSKF